VNYAKMSNDQLAACIEVYQYLIGITPPEPCQGQQVFQNEINSIQTIQKARAAAK
jgi:hypothetical protein